MSLPNEMRLSRRKVTAWVAIAVAAVAAASIGIGAILCEGALHVPASLRHSPDRRAADTLAVRTGSRCTAVEIAARDGAILRAWLFTPNHPNWSGAILFHGVSDTRWGVLGHAEYLLKAGYTVLTPDSRANGESGDDLMTFGVLERSDLATCAAWMRRTIGIQRLYGLGESMGGAILLQSADNFDAVVAEGSFASFDRIARYRLAQASGLPQWMTVPFVRSAFVYARARYGIDLSQASPLDCIGTTRTRVLLIHGTADTNVPPAETLALAAANPRVAVWLVPGATHTAALSAQPAEMKRRVLDWFTGE
jgi:alpha-beta hydrolase superfamily lysophospholipase